MTRTLRREDGRLDPSEPAAALERRVRAYRPWPGTFVETDAGRLIVLDAAVEPGPPGGDVDAAAPGTLVADGDGLALATTDGLLRLVRVQPAGGRAMPSADLRRGRPALVGSRVAGGVRESGS